MSLRTGQILHKFLKCCTPPLLATLQLPYDIVFCVDSMHTQEQYQVLHTFYIQSSFHSIGELANALWLSTTRTYIFMLIL